MFNFHIGDAVYWKGIEMKIVDFVDGIIHAHNADATLRVTDVPETFTPVATPTSPTEATAPVEAPSTEEEIVGGAESEAKTVVADVKAEVETLVTDVKKV